MGQLLSKSWSFNLLLFQIFYWLISPSISLGFPVSPLISLFFVLTVLWEARLHFREKALLKPLNHRVFLLFFLNYSLFLLVLMVSRDFNYLTLSSMFRGGAFLMVLYLGVLYGRLPSLAQLKRVFIYAGSFISVLGFLKILYFYIFPTSKAWDSYTTSLTEETNYFNFPILLGLWAVLSSKKISSFKAFLVVMMSCCVYLSSSRRAFIILFLLFIVYLLKRGDKKIKLLVLALSLYFIPVNLTNFDDRLVKTFVHNLTGESRTWSEYSSIFEYRYLRIFGVNRSINSLRSERADLDLISWLPFRKEVQTTFVPEDVSDTYDKRAYDGGGRFERWAYAWDLFESGSFLQKVFGFGFQYHAKYQKKFNLENSLGYPHLTGASVFLYSGLLGGILFFSLIIISLFMILKSRDVFSIGSVGVIYLLSSLSLDIPFGTYIIMLAFIWPLFPIRGKYQGNLDLCDR